MQNEESPLDETAALDGSGSSDHGQEEHRTASEPIRIGDFEIIRQLGAGGMGIVYLARQVSIDRLVALKVMGSSLSRQSDIVRFQREAQAVAKLSHPNIASVYFIGQDDKLCYMAMEYIDGVSLRDCVTRLSETTDAKDSIDKFKDFKPERPQLIRFDNLNEKPEQSPSNRINPYRSPQAEEVISGASHFRRCAHIVRDAARALQHAHEKGVIHRDLKPDNLMIDKDGSVRIIDFGLAKFFEDATFTQTGALIGTPIYMSPEQVTGRIELDERTDIYSLGIVLYELLVLRHPIMSNSREVVFRNIVVKQLQPITLLNDRIPTPLQNIVHKATAKDPDARYRKAQEFADDLNHFLHGEAVLAPMYRHKIDTSELKASRPAFVLILANCIFIASFFSIFFGIVAFYLLPFEEIFYYYRALPCILLAGVLGFISGFGYITGRRWGLIMTSAGFIASGQVSIIYGCIRFWDGKTDALTAICVIFGGCLFAIGAASILGENVYQWFKSANQIRRNEADHPDTEAAD